MNEVVTKSNELSTDINVITAEINSYKQIAGQAIFEIGRRLKHVKKYDLAHGEFGKWLETVEIDKYDASKYIRVYEEFSIIGNIPNFGAKKLFDIISLPKDIDREKFISESHTIPSTGETKTVEEMTVRELREVKSELKREAERRELAERRAEMADSKSVNISDWL